jgi:hypothetical protein
MFRIRRRACLLEDAEKDGVFDMLPIHLKPGRTFLVVKESYEDETAK